MKQIEISAPQEVNYFIDKFNSSSVLDHLGITSLCSQKNYFKWFAPSIDYPCILNSYYLFPPFQITFSPHPSLTVSQEIGENAFILDQVKQQLLRFILDTYRL